MSRPPRANPMTVSEALRTLGLDEGAEWDDIRRAFRIAIRRSHPDLRPIGDGSPIDATAVNVAYELLESATGGGRRPLPNRPAAPPTEVPARRPRVLRSRAADVFVDILDAAHEVGDVSYVDPEAGLIQVLLAAGPSASQLLIAIDADADPPTASFTLDSMSELDAPDLSEIVDRIGDAMNAAR